MMKPKDRIKFYLDYANNYLTIDRLAEAYNLEREIALYYVETGKVFYECELIENKLRGNDENKS